MPVCYLHTNIPDTDIKEGIEERIAKAIADILNKSLERMVVVVTPGARVFRMGSAAPACSVTISSIGVFDKERNLGYTDPIKELIMKEMNLARERVSLIYHDLDVDMLGK